MTRQILILPTTPNAKAMTARLKGEIWDIQDISLNQLEGHIWQDDLTVVLPGQNIRSFETDLPKASRAQQLKGARFAHEDRLATSPEDLHVALSHSDPVITSFIDRDWFADCLAGLHKRGVSPKFVIADYDGLSGDHKPILLIDRVVTPGPTGHAQDINWAKVENDLSPDAVMDIIAENVKEGRVTNLLQDQFKPRSQFIGSIPNVSRLVGLAAASLIAYFAWQGVTAWALKKQVVDIQAQNEVLYQQITGKNAPNNYMALAAAALQNPQDQSASFLQLSNVLFAGMAGQDDIQLDRLSYNAQRQELQLRVIYPDFDAASRLETAMANAGGDFVTGGVREQGDEFIGEAVLRVAGRS